MKTWTHPDLHDAVEAATGSDDAPLVADHVHPYVTTVRSAWLRYPTGYRTMSQSSDDLKLVTG